MTRDPTDTVARLIRLVYFVVVLGLAVLIATAVEHREWVDFAVFWLVETVFVLPVILDGALPGAKRKVGDRAD